MIENNMYRIFLWIFLFMMAVGSGLIVNMGAAKKWAIKFHEQTLYQEEFDQLAKQIRAQQDAYQKRGLPAQTKAASKEAVLLAMHNICIAHIMHKLHVVIPQDIIATKIDEMLRRLPAMFFNANGSLNEALFARQIAPLTIEDFIKNIQSEVQAEFLHSLITLSSYVPQFELDLSYAHEFARKEYTILKFASSKYLLKVKETAPSAEALEKFYKKTKNSELFKTEEKRAGTIWRFDEKNYHIAITEGDIKKEYEKNKVKYLLTPAHLQVRQLLITPELGQEEMAYLKIEKLRKQAEENPESFESLIKEYSQAKDAAKTGGLTKPFAEDDKDLDATLVKTAFESLLKDGQISTPVKTDKGYVLLQRVKKIPAVYKDLQSVADSITAQLRLSKFKHRFGQDANRAISQARYNPDILTKLLEKGKESKVALTALKAEDALVAQLFKTDVEKYATFFDQNVGYVLLCTEIEKSKVPPLHEVKDAVLAHYYQEESLSLLQDAMAQAMQQIQAGKDIDAVAKVYDAKIEQAHAQYKNNRFEQSSILKSADVQAKLRQLFRPGALTALVSDKDGLVIRLDVLDTNVATDDQIAQKKKHGSVLNFAKRYGIRDGFIASLYRHAKLNKKIEIGPEVLPFTKEA